MRETVFQKHTPSHEKKVAARCYKAPLLGKRGSKANRPAGGIRSAMRRIECSRFLFLYSLL
jgi:hypothetical protein